MERARLSRPIEAQGDYTVLMPTNAAFEELGEVRLAYLMDPANRAELARLLTGHILEGRYSGQDLRDVAGGRARPVSTLGATALAFSVRDDILVATDPTGRSVALGRGGADRANGIVYVVDRVLASSS